MADQRLSEASLSAPGHRAGEQAASAGEDLKESAAEFASSSTGAIKDHASEFADAARDLGSQAADRFKEGFEDQKQAGARYVNSIAEAMRRAAQEFDEDLPIAGTFLRNGASQVEVASEALRNGDFGDLLRDARSFARRQPTAFLGLAVLAGFGAVRFLKSSAEQGGGGTRRQATSQGG
jgi:hypothetical protein